MTAYDDYIKGLSS